MLSLTECVWEFQNNALWDTHQHALLTHVLKRPQERDRRMGAYFEQELGSCSCVLLLHNIPYIAPKIPAINMSRFEPILTWQNI